VSVHLIWAGASVSLQRRQETTSPSYKLNIDSKIIEVSLIDVVELRSSESNAKFRKQKRPDAKRDSGNIRLPNFRYEA
jgi:hypothetical protein